ncbi:MAG: hypothetical protein ABS951_06730 [Solibacillus sp.]
MTVDLKNTFVVRTDDENFEQALIQFLSSRCEEEKVNAAYYGLNEVGAKKVMNIVFEK